MHVLAQTCHAIRRKAYFYRFKSNHMLQISHSVLYRYRESLYNVASDVTLASYGSGEPRCISI